MKSNMCDILLYPFPRAAVTGHQELGGWNNRNGRTLFWSWKSEIEVAAGPGPWEFQGKPSVSPRSPVVCWPSSVVLTLQLS